MKINPIGHLVKTNPIQTQSNPISKRPKMNVNVFFTKDYENKTTLRPQKNKAKTNPISKRPKMNVNSLITKDYRKYDDFAVQENKPNSNPIQTQSKPVLSAVEWANFQKNFILKGVK